MYEDDGHSSALRPGLLVTLLLEEMTKSIMPELHINFDNYFITPIKLIFKSHCRYVHSPEVSVLR